MNRAVVLGIAIFFAVVGIALLGGENQAVAGHGCHGCYGGVVCDGGYACGGYAYGGCGGLACHGAVATCGGVYGRVHRHRAFRRRHCSGYVGACSGVMYGGGGCFGVAVSCCGPVGYTVGKAMPVIQHGPVQKGGAIQKVEPTQKGAAVQKGGVVQKVTYRQVPATYYQVTFRR
ncbi:MAG: hypothetical protein ACC628_06675 [Pirellulaceae bacterium]